MHESTPMSAKGLIRSLYDFKFTSLISQRVIRFLYALAVVLYTVITVILFIALVSKGKAAGAAFAIIVLPVFYFFSLISMRVSYEFLIVFFHIGEDVRVIRLGRDGAASVMVSAPVQAAQTSPAGWYPDGVDTTRLRYWDGSKWTDQFQPRAANS
jgi:hypothetical protein